MLRLLGAMQVEGSCRDEFLGHRATKYTFKASKAGSIPDPHCHSRKRPSSTVVENGEPNLQ
jgi:hypothetical protein